jgi:hypothetical protein
MRTQHRSPQRLAAEAAAARGEPQSSVWSQGAASRWSQSATGIARVNQLIVTRRLTGRALNHG